MKKSIKENFPLNVFRILLLLIISLSSFSSCKSDDTVIEKNNITYHTDYDISLRTVELHNNIEFGYNNHDYILFVLSNGNACVVHNPDCHCFKDNRK